MVNGVEGAGTTGGRCSGLAEPGSDEEKLAGGLELGGPGRQSLEAKALEADVVIRESRIPRARNTNSHHTHNHKTQISQLDTNQQMKSI